MAKANFPRTAGAAAALPLLFFGLAPLPFGVVHTGTFVLCAAGAALLAVSLLTPAHLYVWDEPMNYIDLFSRMQLEELILDRDTYALKADLGNKFAQIVYEGKWFTPIREAIQAFIESTQKYVTGEVKFKLYKGNIIKAGTTSPYTLYNESIASFTTGDMYDHHDAEGFINLFGLSCKVRAMKMQENGEKLL